MPGSMAFVEKARAKGLVALVSGAIAYHVPVIVMPKGNPANVKTPADMARPGLKLLFPDRTATRSRPARVCDIWQAGHYASRTREVLFGFRGD